MPVFHNQYSLEARTPDGRVVQGPPAIALLQAGPWVQVVVSVPRSIADQLEPHGMAVSEPVAGRAIIDTGASVTCIDNDVAAKLGLPAIDRVTMTSASHDAIEQNVYPLQIQVVGLPFQINVPRAMGANLAPQGIVALIGRDFLQHCTLFYNGLTGSITLAI
jgi:predicted aspartyl protease